MTSTPQQRKAALAMSILPASRRALVLDSLPAAQRNRLQLLLSQIIAHGWSDPSVVERALGIAMHAQPAVAIESQELIRLSRLLSPELYARVLIAADISDRGFLVSLLERDYAVQVQKALGDVPTLPDRLKQSLLSAAQAHLIETKVQPCAV